MRIRVPSVMESAGLGQTTSIDAGSIDSSYIPPYVPSPISDLPTDIGNSPSTGIALSLPVLSETQITGLGTPTATVPVTNSQTGLTTNAYVYPSGEIVDANGNILQGPTGSGAGSGLSLSQILGSAATAATTAAKINQSLQSPSLIPGTSLVYNPATGQITNSLGTAQALTSSLSSMLPLLLLAGGAFLLISMMGKRS